MTSSVSNKSVSIRESKPIIDPSSLLVGAIVGGLFTTLALVDISVLSYGPAAFIGQYYIWKQNAPILQKLILVLSFSLPLAILNNCITLYHTFTRQASSFRNNCDSLEFIGLAAVITNTIARGVHVEEQITYAARIADLDAIESYTQQHLVTAYINFALNLLLLVLPFVRYINQENDKVKNAELLQEGSIEGDKTAVVAVIAEKPVQKDNTEKVSQDKTKGKKLD